MIEMDDIPLVKELRERFPQASPEMDIAATAALFGRTGETIARPFSSDAEAARVLIEAVKQKWPDTIRYVETVDSEDRTKELATVAFRPPFSGSTVVVNGTSIAYLLTFASLLIAAFWEDHDARMASSATAPTSHKERLTDADLLKMATRFEVPGDTETGYYSGATILRAAFDTTKCAWRAGLGRFVEIGRANASSRSRAETLRSKLQDARYATPQDAYDALQEFFEAVKESHNNPPSEEISVT